VENEYGKRFHFVSPRRDEAERNRQKNIKEYEQKVRAHRVKKGIRMIANKGKGNKTEWLCVDGFTLLEIELIQFFELRYTIECLNVASVDIDKTKSAILLTRGFAFSKSVVFFLCHGPFVVNADHLIK
jgi:hypothetical protein